MKAIIIMPYDAPKTKIDATKGYGATVIQYDRYKEDREAIARDLSEKKGLTLIISGYALNFLPHGAK